MQVKHELYDRLVEVSGGIKTANFGWSNIAAKLTLKQSEEFYSLILHHIAITGGDINKVPFGAKTLQGGKGMICFVDKLPEELKKILISYLTLS